MTPPESFDRFHVILVDPGESRNVGSVARAMMNLGFRHLHLVAPTNYDRARAGVTACWAAPLLDSLIIHDQFEDAVADMEEVIGLSGRTEINQSHCISLPDWVERLGERPLRKTALVFGPEDNGLSQEHLDKCQWIVHILANEECPSFNLSQAVLLVLYELTRTLPPLPSLPLAEDLPTGNDYFQLERLLESVMNESGFIRTGTPEPAPGTIRSLFRRLPLNRHEMGLLLGLFGRLNRTLLHKKRQ